MKFTPEEMAIDAAEVDAGGAKRYPTAGRRFVHLDADVRRAFPDDAAVNAVLRKVMELQRIKTGGRRKRTA